MAAVRRVTCSLGMSLDGYFTGPDGGLDWSAPDPEVFRFATDQIREVGVHLMGRRLYEAMLVWEESEQTGPLDAAEREWVSLWRPLPKVVFSSTLREVRGGAARLATADLAGEIARLRGEPGDGDIAIGGADLASHAAGLGLLDEYRVRVHPVLLGAGRPLFRGSDRRRDLQLLESRVFASGVTYLRYRVSA